MQSKRKHFEDCSENQLRFRSLEKPSVWWTVVQQSHNSIRVAWPAKFEKKTTVQRYAQCGVSVIDLIGYVKNFLMTMK